MLDTFVSYPEEMGQFTYDTEKLTKEEVMETINATGTYKVIGQITDSEYSGRNYSLFIIGGGSAAFAVAIRISELGGQALIINKGLPVGGTCVNVGCVPSKTLIRAAEAYHRSRNPGFDGIESQSRITDFKKIIDQKREMVGQLRQDKYVNVIKDDPNITLIEGEGTVMDKHTVKVGSQTYQGDNILIATGASPYIPDVPGLEESGYLTNESAYELEELPESLIIVGGGYIALENAQLFARLGSDVTVLQRSPRCSAISRRSWAKKSRII